jgi:hypothetical protein
MKPVSIAYEYAETRNYAYNSIRVGQRVEVELEEGETATAKLDWLKDYVQQRVKDDADEALRSFVEWSDEESARRFVQGTRKR